MTYSNANLFELATDEVSSDAISATSVTVLDFETVLVQFQIPTGGQGAYRVLRHAYRNKPCPPRQVSQ